MLSLRTSVGINLSALEDRYGADLLFEHQDELTHLEQQGLLGISDGHVSLTQEGKHLANAVTERLLLTE